MEIIKHINKHINREFTDEYLIMNFLIKHGCDDDERLNTLPMKIAYKYLISNGKIIESRPLISPRSRKKINYIKSKLENDNKSEINDDFNMNPGYNALYQIFNDWVMSIIKFINIYRDDLSFISMSYYEKQGLGLDIISNVIHELLVKKSKNTLHSNIDEPDEILNILKKIYIMIDLPEYATESVLDSLVLWFTDEQILNDVRSDEKSEMGNLSKIIWQKYNSFFIIEYNDITNKIQYTFDKIDIKYKNPEPMKIYQPIYSIMNNDKLKSIDKIHYTIIYLKMYICNNNITRLDIYLIYLHLKNLVNIYLSTNTRNISNDHKDRTILYLQKIIRRKKELNNKWEINNTDKYNKLSIRKSVLGLKSTKLTNIHNPDFETIPI